MGDYDEPKPKADQPRASQAAPKPKAAPSPKVPAGQKAGSWVHPRGPGKQLVGKVFFKTKESSIDAHDRSLLGDLAKVYAGNRAKPVKGTFEGFADPRPSHEPENNELSQARASTVAHELLRAFVETGVWYESRAANGRGVDATASQIKPEPGIEDTHAPYRRVDIYLDGEPSQVVQLRAQEQDETPQVPDYSDRPRYWEEQFGYHIERGNKSEIEGVAGRILRNTAAEGPDHLLDDTLRRMGITPVKPSWWDARYPAEVHGRGGYRHDQRSEHARRGMQLVRDYQLYVNYLADRRADLHAFYNSGFKDVSRLPDGHNIQTRIGHLRFMIDAIAGEAFEVMRLVR